MVNINDLSVSNWPFPTEDQPLTPWTPEQQKKWAEDQRKNVPESPLMGL